VTRLGHVLLLFQAAAGGLVAVEALLLGGVLRSPVLLLLALLAAGVACVPVVVACGLLAGWGWARGLGVGYELVVLVSGAADGLVLGNDDLVALLFGAVLPAALLCLLLRRPTMSPWSGAGSPAGPTGS
jgi:hypothetical protein